MPHGIIPETRLKSRHIGWGSRSKGKRKNGARAKANKKIGFNGRFRAFVQQTFSRPFFSRKPA